MFLGVRAHLQIKTGGPQRKDMGDFIGEDGGGESWKKNL